MSDNSNIRVSDVKENFIRSWVNNSTFHGIKYVFNPGSRIRRFMWLIFVLGCLSAVVFQIVDRIQFFDSRPTSVNVVINYNTTLHFPAVTICNQNNFRASEAAKHGYYRLIEDMFSQTRHISQDDLNRHHATNLSMEELYTSLAHRKEDFIVNCVWKSGKCSYRDFDTVITDHGVCFMFKKSNHDVLVSSSGVKSGLRLTLNVEQYEYMTGPHDAAGVKILLHDPRETPLVHELGMAVPTGTHAFVGVKFMVIDNLPKPHGDCDTKQLGHTDYYTTEECYLDCLVKLAQDVCGCRASYMPHNRGYPPVCTVGKSLFCLEDLNNNFSSILRESCGCPIPCHFALYDPSVSYATVSNHLINKLLTSSEARNLVRKLEVASEVTAKMENGSFAAFVSLVSGLFEKYEIVKEVVSDVTDSLAQTKNITNRIYTEMEESFNKKEMIYRYQEYSIEQNFLRAREAMEERTLNNIVYAYAEFAEINRRRILRLGKDNKTEDKIRLELYKLILDELKVRQKIAEMGRANVTLLIDSFINGTPIFNYKFEDLPRSHNEYIVPKQLMNYSMHYNSYVKKYVPKYKTQYFDLMNSILDMFVEQAQIAYENITVDETKLDYVFERFQFACRNFMYSKSVVDTYGFELPSMVIKERLDAFKNEWIDFADETTGLNQNVKFLTDSIEKINENVIPAIDLTILKMKGYSENSTGSLMDLADSFLSSENNYLLNRLQDFFQEVQGRGQQIQDILHLIENPILNIWTTILTDDDSYDYYTYTNNYLFMRNLSEVLEEWKDNLNRLKELDVRRHVSNTDNEFFTAIDDVADYLYQFKDSIVIDGNFMKQNFLQVDIFYRQLSYESINQQKAYDFFALICDIGGAMGLFIGASMLTIVEIIDLLLIQLPVFKRGGKPV